MIYLLLTIQPGQIPDLVGQIHQEYVRAGSDILETNTFGANRIKLRQSGLVEARREVNGQITTQVRYYLSSLPVQVERFSEAVRGH